MSGGNFVAYISGLTEKKRLRQGRTDGPRQTVKKNTEKAPVGEIFLNRKKRHGSGETSRQGKKKRGENNKGG